MSNGLKACETSFKTSSLQKRRKMKAKPYDWQIPHIEHLIDAFTKHPYLLDASDTGTGKTFTSLFVCKALEISPFVVAPKIVLSPWREAAEEVGVELLDVVNIEKLKAKKHDALHKLPSTGTKKRPITNWKWNLPKGTLVIWDEVQNAGGLDTQNARALFALRKAGLPCLALSATVADDPMRLKALGYLLGLHGYTDYRAFCIRHGCVRNPFAGGFALMFTKSQMAQEVAMSKIHRMIFPEKGGRLRIEALDTFPDNRIIADAYDLPDHKEVQAIYTELEDQLESGDTDEIPIVAQLRARQRVELMKSVLFTQLTLDALEEGKSVAVFVNFKATMNAIEEQLKKAGVPCGRIEGGQTEVRRNAVRQNFQLNSLHVILIMIQAGGIGISLHDLHGRPRESIISPPYSAKELKQALGRIHRAGSKSKAIQKIVFVAGTIEERACQSVRRKLANLSTLNDGDIAIGAGF
jgi:superfamily II DNA or RNA helicase